MSTSEHRQLAKGQRIAAAVLTISDTRTLETDSGGQIIVDLLQAAGHHIAARAILPDEPMQIRMQLDLWLAPDPGIDVIFTTGGTGIAKRDTTIEVVDSLLDQTLPGFGELFRMLSYHEVGPAAMLSRAVAGLAGDSLIFAMPGSVNAVTLAMEKLILPELEHLVWERRR